MALRLVNGRRTGESGEDLQVWLQSLDGCPEIARTTLATCPAPSHGDDLATWFYVEADAAAGVARRRCLACGLVTPLLDSEQRWTFPPTLSCFTCRQSIVEVAFGVHVEQGAATWVAMAVRCVECGGVTGATDAFLEPTDVEELLARL